MTKIVAFLYGILLVSVFTDTIKGKIPNRLILIGSIVGILGTHELWSQLIQAFAVFLLLFTFFAGGVIGAGDVKCICMIGLYLEQELYITSILSSFFIAALFSVFILLQDLIFTKSKALQRKHTIHLALPIFLGVLISTGGTYL